MAQAIKSKDTTISLEEKLWKIDADYLAGEDEENNKEKAINALKELHYEAMQNAEQLADFREDALHICGGIYVPYLCWFEVGEFIENQGNRAYLFEVLKAFVNSDFSEQEQAAIKPLLIIYFALDKPFEINKFKVFVLEKAHKTVQDYFQNIFNFVEKNKLAVNSFIEKMKLLKGYEPQFELLRLPIAKLQEQLLGAIETVEV